MISTSISRTDRYWNAIISNGGTESACGWCKDRWGHSWQITPRILLDLTTHADPEIAKKSFEVMMTMTKIEIAPLEAVIKGKK